MTTPVDIEPGGMSAGASASIEIVVEAVGSAITSTLALIATPLMLAGFVVALALGALLLVRAGREISEGKRYPDPRPLIDPTASDVLGEL